jgi:RHS repeat-associated protein
MFSSKRFDKETGLMNFGRRCYDPTLGRFVTADPSGFADGPNLYAYCGGDPVNLIDPDGQLSKSFSSGSSAPSWLSSTQNDLHSLQTYGYSFEDSLRGTMAPGIAAISSLGSINSLQRGLDIAGMAHPAFDVLNAGISWSRGDNVGAAASLLATATIIPSAALKGSVHVADTMSSVVNSGRRTISSGLSASSTIENSAIRTGGGLSSAGVAKNTQMEFGFIEAVERQTVARDFYRATTGWGDTRIASHMRGIDFSQPVNIVNIPAGTSLTQFNLPGRVGNYYAPVGTPANSLGIYTSGFVENTHVFGSPTRALQSTAASVVDDWSMRGSGWRIQTEGGGTQFFVPNR